MVRLLEMAIIAGQLTHHYLRILFVFSALAVTPGLVRAEDDHRERAAFGIRPVKNGVFYFPVGRHFSHNSDVSRHDLLGVIHQSWTFAVFENTYGNTTAFLGRGHNFWSHGRFGADVFYGLMYGYHGRLATAPGIPSALRPLYEGELNPAVLVSPFVRLSTRSELRVLITPQFWSLGLKVNF